MSPLLSQPIFQTWALCSCLLVIMLYALGFYTAKVRNDKQKVINHEDVKVNSGATPVDIETPEVQRIKRAHGNAIENLVPFFVIGFLYTQTLPNPMMANALFYGFLGLRLLHAVFYLAKVQPFRTMCFALGGVINLTMVVQVLRALL